MIVNCHMHAKVSFIHIVISLIDAPMAVYLWLWTATTTACTTAFIRKVCKTFRFKSICYDNMLQQRVSQCSWFVLRIAVVSMKVFRWIRWIFLCSMESELKWAFADFAEFLASIFPISELLVNLLSGILEKRSKFHYDFCTSLLTQTMARKHMEKVAFGTRYRICHEGRNIEKRQTDKQTD